MVCKVVLVSFVEAIQIVLNKGGVLYLIKYYAEWDNPLLRGDLLFRMSFVGGPLVGTSVRKGLMGVVSNHP